MSKKDGMYCYYDWIKPLKKVPAEDFKALLIAMLEYHQNGTPPPDFDGIAGIAADFIFPQIERSKKYAEIGAKGGAITQSKGNASTVASTVASTPKHKHILNTNTKTNNYAPPTPSKGESAGFEEFWKAYPKRRDKQNAIKAWNKLKPDTALQRSIMEALTRAKRSEDWQKDGGKYIPLPSTYISGRRWEDEIEEVRGADDRKSSCTGAGNGQSYGEIF